MNSSLKTIQELLQQNNNLSGPDKEALIRAISDADKQWSITEFKLDRTEKVKKTTAILLEETIEELEHKRKAVEAQNRELEIESSLEKVRTVAMGMRKRDDMLDICRVMSAQLELLGFKEIRNVQTAIFYKEKGTYVNYEYYRLYDQTFITEVDYTLDEISTEFANQMMAGPNEIFIRSLIGDQVKDWLNFQKTTNVFIDTHLEKATSLTYYWFSLGPVALGTSTYEPLNEAEIKLFERFRNVFGLAYQRYIDIEQAEAQAREAQIQLALERVRARTMAMQRSEELSGTAQVLFHQFNDLGAAPIQITIGIFNEEERVIEFRSTDPLGTGARVDYAVKGSIEEPTLLKKIYADWKEGKKSTVIALAGNELSEWVKYRITMSGVPDKKDYSDERRVVYVGFFSKGMLSVSSIDDPSSESVQLLERFAGVFDLTYTRFLDLKQAEAQARESQIQLALERVRSRAMAMQKSGELSELVDTVFKELTKLDFALNWCIINIIDESSLSNTVWAANPDISKAPESYHMKFEDYPFHDAMMEAYKKRATKYIYVLEGAEKKFYDEYLFNETEFRRVPAEAQAASRAMEKYVVSFSFGNFGGLQTVGNEPLSEANLDILERFGKVFDLTYTRFNDLLKAEAQAREAQIEAALERVRSRSMGMQKSEELKEVIQVVYEQFVHLNIKVEHTGFIMDYKERDDMRIWLADKHAVPFQVTIPYFDCAHWNSFNEAKEKGLDFFANHLSFEEKNKFYQDLFKLFPVPDEAKEYYFSCPGLAISTVLLENVGLYIENFSGISYSDEENNTLMRFGKVFQQSYTRFLDLQKAEVQAREAKIEAALERTRTQSMIMQHSKELDDVLRVFHEQVLMLGIHSAFSFLWLPDEKNDRHIFWATWAENVSPAQLVSHNSTVFRSKAINYPLDRNEPATAQCLVDWKGDEPIVSYYVPPAGVENYFAAWQELIDGVEQLKPGHFSGGLYYVEAFMKYGCFGVMVATDLNEEEKKILGRFAVEFERTYTRFLDLQKAEAQAREAKIETALERVRAASLAMHHSNELHSVADVLFQQLRSFGGDIMNAGIALCREDLDEDEFWLSSDDGLRPVISIPHTEDAIQKKLYEDWKNKSEFFSIAKGGDELRAHYNYMSSVPSLKPFFQEGPDWSFPTWQKWHAAYFSHGYVFMITLEPYEEEKILVRFAKVFEQAYTRFLDLQKAEAQAKESQIQLALERIRARTMAMQKSDELAETASLLFKQLLALGVGQKQIRTCAIVTFHTEKPIGECWVTKPNGDIIPQSFMVPYDKMESYKTIYAAWKNGEKFHIVHLAGNALLQHLDNLKEYTDIPVQQFEAVLEKNAESYTHALFFSQGYLYIISSEPLPEYHDIFKRFGSVFEQTYTRFLDLKKAESQAREAHIEAALEKVRSRTMAMQKSNELAETAEVVFQQLISFGIEAHRLYIGIINDESGDLEIWMTDEKGNQVSKRYVVNIHKNISIKKMYEGWEEQQQTLSIDMLGNELHEWITYWNKEFGVPFMQGAGQQRRVQNLAYFSKGFIATTTFENAPNEIVSLLNRFAAVFNLTYTRFNDLQLAEAQVREAKIEAALEKVRSRTMAMQRSDELSETAAVLFQEFKKLGEEKLLQITIGIYHEAEGLMEFRVTSWAGGGEQINEAFKLDIEEPTLLKPAFTAWKEQKKSIVVDLAGKELEGWLNYRNAKTGVTVFSKDTSGRRVVTFAFFPKGHISFSSPEPRPPETVQLLERFAGVFDLTYTRFIDLQKAEANTKEAQIELSLERVRARTMAMHNSQDVADTVATMFDELIKLGIETLRCGIGIMQDAGQMEVWTAKANENRKAELVIGRLDMMMHPLLQGAYNGWKNKQDTFSYELKGDDLVNYYTLINEHIDYPVKYDISSLPSKIAHNDFYFAEGTLFVFSPEVLSVEASQVLKRFSAVFGQTYRRYLDLQKAEAQAKEAQVEAGLERARGKAMAMHKSDDLKAAVAVVFEELDKLALGILRCGIGILDKEKRTADVWTTSKSDLETTVHVSGDESLDIHPLLQGAFDAWLRKESFSYVLQGEDLVNYYQAVGETNLKLPQSQAEVLTQYYYVTTFQSGGLFAFNDKELPEEAKKIMNRFANVFDLTYKRFLDLQKAEAQTRDAKIEAAMEKVRSRAMAMQKPEELVEVAQLLRNEMGLLGVEELETSSIYIHDENSGTTECWYAIQDIREQDRKLVADHMILQLNDTWVGREMLKFYLSGEKQISILMQGENRKEWINYCSQHSKLLQGYYGDEIPERTYHLLKFSSGFMGAAAPGNISAESWELLKRATAVFSLAYTRFNDLQIADASAKEAIKQSALDRIRADIASMRTISDLDRITPLIWNELMILGIPFIRCGVFIMDESQELIHTFLSTPDGKAIAAFHIPYTTPGNIGQVLSHWRDGKNYIDHWDEKEFREFADTLVRQGVLGSSQQYLQTIPHGGFYLHFLPFLQGMLYVGNTNQLSGDEINLIQSVADAFSTAYARYEDFNRLEAAKQQVEKTLVDLKQAQTQLVQSEKMASLGELTAGIAHEIQNPLNFVNNFSEVNNELIEELKMKNSTLKINDDEVNELLNDIYQNNEKISNHGKRADAIVKGMLQHSRTSSGQKELTDINVLADEYLRLCYHGLRAKDKSFNATIKTDFASSLEKINIIPQDIGRVILNLLTNAFYAVGERRASTGSAARSYEPTVCVSTALIPPLGARGPQVQIKVVDNGGGIPQKVLDKIFQPFFTTKPTGQGTGLGLSLSYDIIKAHGGEIKVETKVGEGSEFIIQLPVV